MQTDVLFNSFVAILYQRLIKKKMVLILWLILLAFSWPLALMALILYPIFWLLLLPFRLIGVAVDGIFELLKAIFTFPGRIINKI